MKIFGQLEDACIEQLASDPVASVQGRVFENTTQGRIKHDNGVTKRALFRNDDKMIVGNDVVDMNNVRIHRGGAGLIQDVLGNDATAEGSPSNAIAQRSMRAENKLSSGLPTNGNAGRHIFVTDQFILAEDDGTNWRRYIPEFATDDAATGGTISLSAITSSIVRLTGSFTTLSMIPAGFPSQRVTLINRTGADVSVAHDSGATPANRIYTGTGANLVLKANAALPIYYDSATSRWQVVGEAAGATAGGGGMPNASVASISADYTALITDDVILADCSSGPINVTLPTAVGNLGKRFLIEKVGSRQNNLLSLIGTINGITNEDIWPLNTPLEIMSDGSQWKTVSEARGTFIIEPINPANIVLVAAVSTGNVSLETFSQTAGTTLDNIVPKSGMWILLKNQSAPEENGLYVLPTSNITIAATATGNVDISTLANGTVVNAHVCSTGEKVSLRFQTVSSENGIYVVGANAGESVRDTSLRAPGYTTPASLRDLLVWADFYNYPAASISVVATESVASHANDLKLWKQKTDNLTTFTGAVYSTATDTYSIKVPSNVTQVSYEICPYGGAGAGGTNARGGASGSGAMPFSFTRKVNPGSTITLTMPLGTAPGSGKTGAAGGQANIVVAQSSPSMSQTVVGALGALATGGAAVNTASALGGPVFNNGATNNGTGPGSYFQSGGTPGTGGASAGGGGASTIGKGGSGGNGSAAANFLGGNGTAPTAPYYGAGGGGGGQGPASGRPGRGGFGGPGYVKLTWG